MVLTPGRRSVNSAAKRFGWTNPENGEHAQTFTLGDLQIRVTYRDDGECSGGTLARCVGDRDVTRSLIVADCSHESPLAAVNTIRAWLRESGQEERKRISGQINRELATPTWVRDSYSQVVKRMRSTLGVTAIGVMGRSLFGALVLAQVLREIAQDADAENPMVQFARYAVARGQSEEE